ncbi:MAG: hypothetical protein AMXMBFR84_06180 [Candidatus Hydrogenedentota bacterium]
MSLIVDEQRIAPVRGLVVLQNHRGSAFSAIDVKRWLRLNRIVFNAEKVDVLVNVHTIDRMNGLLRDAEEMGVRLSIRCEGEFPGVPLLSLKQAGLLDVFLTLPEWPCKNAESWAKACRDADVPLRLQLHAPFCASLDAESIAAEIALYSPVSVNIATYDPFIHKMHSSNSRDTAHTLDRMNALVRNLAAREIEVNLTFLPFCHVSNENWPHAVNSPQFFLDHQQYRKGAYELAQTLYRNPYSAVGKILLIMTARATFQRTFVDAVLLRLLMHSRFLMPWMVGWHKLTRHLHRLRGRARAADETNADVRKRLEQIRADDLKRMGPECGECSLRRICDRVTPAVAEALPGLNPKKQEGELVVSAMHFCAHQPKHYDAIDRPRRSTTDAHRKLVHHANEIVENVKPDQQLMPYEYGVEAAPFEPMEGGVRWHSLAAGEKVSTALPQIEPPCTISVGFGGGIADYIGFSFGRHIKVVCPMEGYRHTLTLHVERDGHYVLLRDGKAVSPVEFEGLHYAPVRLPTVLNPRISIWNIDTHIVTQFVKIWRGEKSLAGDANQVKYSVVVVNSRYARRLQAMLRSLAHQRNFDLRKLEVIVCYIPGLDATDDLIDSMHNSFPELRILRAPFPAQNANAKGFMINEGVNMASGEWTVLMDADIVLSPDMFARVEEESANCNFIAADGRKMLSKEDTAKILLGEIQPWDEWDRLLKTASEYRYREAKGVPVGFFQCFRTEFMRKVKYHELDHFEGADMWFGMALQDKYGKEVRLSGLPVLHLDHGGSQWYGTTKHF